MSPPVTSPPEARLQLGHRAALDGIRGVAIACVVLNHTIGFPTTGLTGVELFFVLSGFLITTLLVEERARTGGVSLRNFYRRRALRLLPALVVLLGAFLVYAAVEALVAGGSLDRAFFGVAAGLGYFTNIALVVDPAAIPNELRHLWSLAIEEQFYIVWPPVLFLVLRGRTHLALGVLAVACGLGVFQQMSASLDGAGRERIVFGTDTGSTAVLVGCMVALALVTTARGWLERAARTATPLAIACFGSLLMIDPQQRLTLFSPWVLLFAVSSACLIVAALESRSRFARVLSVAPMTFLGRISYSLYLWHVAIYWAFDLHTYYEPWDLPALTLSFACAVASYYFVEKPFLRRKRRLRASTEADDISPRIPAFASVSPRPAG